MAGIGPLPLAAPLLAARQSVAIRGRPDGADASSNRYMTRTEVHGSRLAATAECTLLPAGGLRHQRAFRDANSTVLRTVP